MEQNLIYRVDYLSLHFEHFMVLGIHRFTKSVSSLSQSFCSSMGWDQKGLMYYGVRSLKRGYPLPASPKEQINLKSGKLRIILGLPLFRL
jgi:hypothetical protein